ncbi:MAG TPA: recombinase family protein [Candidatus Paceibacterota bacterium]|nr:recombinase family protein [Candidatus Paceibacterota bacterium]
MEQQATKVRYCLYARKSTEQEEKQALSIESQVNEMKKIAEREGLEIVDIKREAHSAKASGQREEFKKLLDEIREKKYDGILVWHPDRLSRNAGDLGSVVDLMDQKLLAEIRTYGQKFTNNPNDKFLLMILCSQAKLENDNKSVNVKRGLRTRCEMGLWPAPAPTGYVNSSNVNEVCVVHIDPIRAPIIKQVFEKVGYEGWGGKKVYQWLKDREFTARSGKPLTLSNIFIILHNHFYYGTFEYPKNSAKFYQGKHTPLISKELFDQVQNQLRCQRKSKETNKEFAFTKLMTCGLCGSGITAQEKFKNLADGSVKKYIYYGCTKIRDTHCKNGYLEEGDLVKQLLEFTEKIDLDQSGLRKKLHQEIERHKKFSIGILGGETCDYSVKDIDIRNYAKYLIKEGNIFEKRDLLTCFKSKIVLRNKKITVLN